MNVLKEKLTFSPFLIKVGRLTSELNKCGSSSDLCGCSSTVLKSSFGPNNVFGIFPKVPPPAFVLLLKDSESADTVFFCFSLLFFFFRCFTKSGDLINAPNTHILRKAPARITIAPRQPNSSMRI